MRDLESNTLLYSSLLPRANYCRRLFYYLNAASRSSPSKQLVIARPQTSANKEMFFSTSMSIAILLPFLLLAAMAAATDSLTECQTTCGGIDIPYPFGIGTNCFLKGFQIDCRNTGSDDGPQPFLAGTSIKVVILSTDPPIAQVMLPVGRQCYNKSMPSEISDTSNATTSLEHSDVFRISNKRSMLVVLGCNTIAAMVSTTDDEVSSGCVSYCNSNSFNNMEDGLCTGTGCCHVDIKPEVSSIAFVFLHMDRNQTMPVWLDWAIRDNISIPLACKDAEKTTDYASSKSIIVKTCRSMLQAKTENLGKKE